MGMDADATLAWGVYLNTGEYKEPHESLFDEDGESILDNYSLETTLEKVYPLVEMDRCGIDCDWGHFLVIKRTKTWAYGYGYKEVDPDSLKNITPEEYSQLHAWLDKLGYTGPREVKLYVFASYG